MLGPASSLIELVRLWLYWRGQRERAQAEREKNRQHFEMHDRYQIQKNKVRAIRQELHDAVAAGRDANSLRMLENDLAVESRYFRTLGDHVGSGPLGDGEGGNSDAS